MRIFQHTIRHVFSVAQTLGPFFHTHTLGPFFMCLGPFSLGPFHWEHWDLFFNVPYLSHGNQQRRKQLFLVEQKYNVEMKP